MGESVRYRLIHGQCIDILPTLADASVDCVVTDPPYPEIDRPYGRLTEEEWNTLMHGVVAQCRRVLKPSGSAVFVLQPNFEVLGRMRPWLWEFMAWTAREWNMVQDAWWWNTVSMPTSATIRTVGLMRPSVKACVWLGSPKCHRNQGEILWRETDSNAALRATARAGLRYTPSGHHVDDKRTTLAAVERGGVTPYNMIPMSNANSTNGGGADGHGAATPLSLCSWWVRYLCPPGGVVLDMFAGSGTVGIAALSYGCRFIGIEKESSYCEMAGRRLAKSAAQEILPLFEEAA